MTETIEIIRPVNAAPRAGVTPAAIRVWCQRFGIGRKVGGRWHLDKALLERMLAGEPLPQLGAGRQRHGGRGDDPQPGR
jgi:hypothetical protein